MPELDPEQWAEVEQLFARALELSPDERGTFLAQECRTDEIRREVASLLQHEGSEPLINTPAIAAAAASLVWETNPDERLIGTRLGSYRREMRNSDSARNGRYSPTCRTRNLAPLLNGGSTPENVPYLELVTGW